MANEEKPLMVSEHIQRISYDLEGPIDKAIDFLASLRARYPECYLSVDVFCAEGAGYESYYSTHVYQRRPENEKERDLRLKAEEVRAKKAEEYERRQYEMLKQKFGG